MLLSARRRVVIKGPVSDHEMQLFNDPANNHLVDSSKSSTFVVNDTVAFQASYVDGSTTTGDYFTDAFGIGDSSVKNFQMGLALNSSIPQGIMGIAFDTAEGGGLVQYPNLVDMMVNEKIIATQAYSLWLDDRG